MFEDSFRFSFGQEDNPSFGTSGFSLIPNFGLSEEGAREEIGEMMVKILREGAQLGSLRREGAQLGSLRRQRGGFGSEKEAPASLGSDSGTTEGGLARLSDWERLSQWDPPQG